MHRILYYKKRLTKSSIAPINCGSGTFPGAHVSSRNENLSIPSRSGSVGIKNRSLRITTSESLGPSAVSYELLRLKSIIRKKYLIDRLLIRKLVNYSFLPYLLDQLFFSFLCQYQVYLNVVQHDVVLFVVVDQNHQIV